METITQERCTEEQYRRRCELSDAIDLARENMILGNISYAECDTIVALATYLWSTETMQ